MTTSREKRLRRLTQAVASKEDDALLDSSNQEIIRELRRIQGHDPEEEIDPSNVIAFPRPPLSA